MYFYGDDELELERLLRYIIILKYKSVQKLYKIYKKDSVHKNKTMHFPHLKFPIQLFQISTFILCTTKQFYIKYEQKSS